MYDLGIKSYTPIWDREKQTSDKVFPPSMFDYNDENDAYICPNKCVLRYTSVNKNKRVKIYSARINDCRGCPLKEQCIGCGINRPRTLKRSFYHEEALSQRANSYTPRYYEIQRKRRIYCEGNFAIQKDNYNLRSTRKRGNAAVTEHCLYSAMALNLKRLVRHLKGPPVPLFVLVNTIQPLGFSSRRLFFLGNWFLSTG